MTSQIPPIGSCVNVLLINELHREQVPYSVYWKATSNITTESEEKRQKRLHHMAQVKEKQGSCQI